MTVGDPAMTSRDGVRSGGPSPVIVVGMDCITGLQTARIFWRRGVAVIGVASDPKHFACRSRSVSKVVTSATHGQDLIDALLGIRSELSERPVLIPCTDASVYAISESRDQLHAFHVLLPRHETVHSLMDKSAFQEFAERHSIPVPRSRTVRTRADVLEVANELTFPLVVKPPRKSAEWRRRTRVKAFEVASVGELLELWDDLATWWTGSLVVQEWIVGGEDQLFSCNVYFDKTSQPLATFVARKLRQWPPRTGTSASGEECRNDQVLETSLRLFTAAGYHGLGYVEIKRDERTGAHYVIEPNIGRPTGRSAIAEAGGVELLMTAYADAIDVPLPEHRTQQYRNARWVYLRHDLQAAIHGWRRGECTPVSWYRSLRGKRTWAVWSGRDPVPFFLDFLRAGRKLVRMGSRQVMNPKASAPVGVANQEPAAKA